MKLHWSPKSPYVRKVMICAHELGLVDQISTIRSVANMNAPNPAILPDNPLSKIPTMVLDDGQVLLDSLTICEYLDMRAGGNRMIPATGPERWTALSWHGLGSGLLDVLILWRNEREKPLEKQTASWIDAFTIKVQACLRRLNEIAPQLGHRPFGIGHIAIGCTLSYMDFRFAALEWREGHPALARWYQDFAVRPSAIATEIVDG